MVPAWPFLSRGGGPLGQHAKTAGLSLPLDINSGGPPSSCSWHLLLRLLGHTAQLLLRLPQHLREG